MSWVSYLDQFWGCEASKETSQDWKHKGPLIVSPPHWHPEGPPPLLHYSGISQAHVLWHLSFFRMASGIRHCLLLPSLPPQSFKLPHETCCFCEAHSWHLIPRFQVIKQDMVTNIRKMAPALWRKSKSIPFPHPFFELPPFPPATLPHLSYLDRNPYV